MINKVTVTKGIQEERLYRTSMLGKLTSHIIGSSFHTDAANISSSGEAGSLGSSKRSSVSGAESGSSCPLLKEAVRLIVSQVKILCNSMITTIQSRSALTNRQQLCG